MKYCLGTVQFGLNYGIQGNHRPDLDLVYSLLDKAISCGIFCFDTAIAYGDAEQILGRYFETRKVIDDNVKIITKDKSSYSLNQLISNIKESINRLHIRKLYGFLYHDSSSVYNNQSMNMLKTVRKEQYAEKIGVSIYTPDEALQAINYDIDIIQVPYNLFDNRLDKVVFFKKAKEKGIEIYARSSLLQGLALMDCNNLPDNVKFAKVYLSKFDDLCKKYNISRLNAAVNYVSFNEYIDYIVFGTDNMRQLSEYLSIRDCSVPSDFIKEIKITFDKVPEKLVNPVLWK